ncbi:MAG: hypothetical protein OHK005_12900 [Candidatus Methylacidiphilales bacterium]
MAISPRFQKLSDQLPDELAQAGFTRQNLPTWARAENPASSLRLDSWLWRHPSGTEARTAWIEGPRSAVVNLMVFPLNANAVPIFASELIAFGPKVHVAVIDHQMAGGRASEPPESHDILTPLHQRWAAHFPSGGELPAWATSHFTPWCIYTRGLPVEDIGLLEEAFLDFWRAWVSHWLPRANSDEPAHPALTTYLHHHIANTPGRPFLGKFFGEAWAERYLKQFMYGPLRPHRELLSLSL